MDSRGFINLCAVVERGLRTFSESPAAPALELWSHCSLLLEEASKTDWVPAALRTACTKALSYVPTIEEDVPDEPLYPVLRDLLYLACEINAGPPKHVESIRTLIGQKVPEFTICAIYGWTLSNGSPDLRKLEEEIDNPGKHTKGFVPPVELDRLHRIGTTQKSICDLCSLIVQQDEERSTPPAPPESFEELVEQGLSVQALSQMYGTDSDTIRTRLLAAKLTAPDNYPSPNALRGRHEPDLPRAEAAAIDRTLSTDDEATAATILSLHAQGDNPTKIKERLAVHGIKFSIPQIRNVIRVAELKPVTAAEAEALS